MKKIAIIGYGQMGKLIEQLAPDYGFAVCVRIDPLLGNEINPENLRNTDLCFEFTQPQSAAENLRKLITLNKNIICGTTGWFDQLPEIRKLVENHHTTLVYGTNFSFGMNLFYKIVANTTQLMDAANDYDPYGIEFHHRHKKDSPSGTARTLSEIILKNLNRKSKTHYEKLDRKIDEQEFHFASVRGGEMPGIHLIGFDSAADTIELKHIARNRTGLAIGALKAAEWIEGNTGSFDFADIFEEILKK